MEPLKIKVHYYETDKMGIVHHANYIHWMEDARLDYFAQMGYSYEHFEESGLVSPVLGYEISLKESTRYGDTVSVEAKLEKYNSVRFTFSYIVRKENGHIAATGRTDHCFVDGENNVIILKKKLPEMDAILKRQLEEDRQKD